MAEENKNSGLFWLGLILIGGAAAWVIKKYIAAPKKDTTILQKDTNNTNNNGGTKDPIGVDTVPPTGTTTPLNIVTHYEYPNIPPKSYLLDMLNNKVKMNNWEFYQAYLQGIYIFPKKTPFEATFISHPPEKYYYWDVVYNPPNTLYYNSKDSVHITWHYTNGSPYPDWSPLAGTWATNTAEGGIRNDDNTWTINMDASIHNQPSKYSEPRGTKYDYKGNKIN